MVPVPIRIAMAVLGALLIGAAEIVAIRQEKAGAAGSVMQRDVLGQDALVFILRVSGAVLLVAGLGLFVLANHAAPR